VSLRRDETDAQLVVADNGRGMDSTLRSGMGLANMRERASALPRGRFEFDSAVAQGTRIRIVFSTAEDHPA
jgi:signal transduction histidine kinase